MVRFEILSTYALFDLGDQLICASSEVVLSAPLQFGFSVCQSCQIRPCNLGAFSRYAIVVRHHSGRRNEVNHEYGS